MNNASASTNFSKSCKNNSTPFTLGELKMNSMHAEIVLIV